MTAVRHVRGHVLWLHFSDGIEGEVDLADGLAGELFAAVRDRETFGRVTIRHGTVVWPNGADWAAESLYKRVLAEKGSIISRFSGIVIRMLTNEHAPPHFHAVYGEYEVTVTIDAGVVTGRFPGRALRHVLEWRDLHEAELVANWERLRAGRPPRPFAVIPAVSREARHRVIPIAHRATGSSRQRSWRGRSRLMERHRVAHTLGRLT